MMPWLERRRRVEASCGRFVRTASMLGVQWRASRRAFRVTVLFAVTRVRVGASGHGETAYGEAASSKSEEVTYACYVSILKYSPPTIYHGQDSVRYGRRGLG